MNKRILITTLVAAGSLAALSMTAAAGQATAAQPAATPAGQAAAPAKVTPRAVPPLDSHQCIRDTGSHIRRAKGECLPVAGRSYGQEDVQRTGAQDVGRALQRLDPSVTVHGH